MKVSEAATLLEGKLVRVSTCGLLQSLAEPCCPAVGIVDGEPHILPYTGDPEGYLQLTEADGRKRSFELAGIHEVMGHPGLAAKIRGETQ